MAATSPPAPGRDLLARLPRHASPSPPAPSAIPAANGNSKVPDIDRSIDDPIPEHLLHGGVRRVANSRSEGSEMQQSEGLGDGQDFDGDDLVNAGRKRKQCKNLPPEPKRHKNTITKLIPNQRKKPNESPLAPTIIKGASPGLRSPMQVTSSPGVNYLVKSAAVKRANMAGSPKTPQPPRCSQLGSPSLENLSPHTRATNSQASKRKRRKLISEIWREAEPIYKDGKLVEGKCNHCHQTFAASRDTGTSHMKRHLKVCEAKTAMNDMIAKMGRPDEIDPNWDTSA